MGFIQWRSHLRFDNKVECSQPPLQTNTAVDRTDYYLLFHTQRTNVTGHTHKQPLVEGEVSKRPSTTWMLFRILFFGQNDKKRPSFTARASLERNPKEKHGESYSLSQF